MDVGGRLREQADSAVLGPTLLDREHAKFARRGVHRTLDRALGGPEGHLSVILAMEHEQRTLDLVDDALEREVLETIPHRLAVGHRSEEPPIFRLERVAR